MKKKYFDEYGRGSRLYRIYSHMKERCYSPNTKCYRNYGGRGIAICEEWKNDYLEFKNWALTNGYREDLTIDRIDNDGDYCPQNCRWADTFLQASNKRNNHLLTLNGKTKTLSQWSRECGLKITTIYMRVKQYGWTVEEALTTPPQSREGSV
jgi:hypothetical protein